MEKIGKYRILGELGAGGFGTVYKASDPDTGRIVAIKLLKAQDDPGIVKRFHGEARTVAVLGHPNIVTVFEFGDHNGRPYLVMEYLEGATLSGLIEARTPLSLLEKVDVMCQVALGLKAAHEAGIAHRDVKPANLMRLSNGVAKIMDFGISRAMGNVDTRLTQTGFVMGTPSYMAPELFTGEGEADYLCDIWAFGVVLYEFLSGVNPFHASTSPQVIYRLTMEEPRPLSQNVAGVPERLDAVARRLLSKKRDGRYQAMDDVCFDLEAILLDLRQPEIDLLIARAEALIASRRLDEAQGVVRRVLELDRSNTWARKRRGEIQEIARAKELVGRADAALGAGDDAGAIKHLEEALRLDSSSDARNRLAEIRAKQERLRAEEATRILQQAGGQAVRPARETPPVQTTGGLTFITGTQSVARQRRLGLSVGGTVFMLALAAFLYLKLSPAEYVLHVSPAELSFEYQAGGALPGPGQIDLTGKPAGAVWTFTASDSWFAATPVQRAGDGAVQIRVDPGRLSPGEYTGQLTVSAKNASAPPATIRIHLKVAAVPRQNTERTLDVSPAEISFAYQQGGTIPWPGKFDVRIKPAGAAWTASASDRWFAVSVGQSQGDGSFQVECHPNGFGLGEYTGYVTVRSVNAPVPPVTARVHLVVTQAAPPKAESGNRPDTERRQMPAKESSAKNNQGDQEGTKVNPTDGLTYVYIPPGSFTMGCSPGDNECSDDEKPPHAERIAAGFWLGRTEVTQAAWKKVMKVDSPSKFKGDQLPVESVDWNQASAYCKAIGGRLPTEQEWEYAARGGTSGARYGALDAIAWYGSNSGSQTRPVGQKTPNGLGLYDMLGNVWEWTSSNYDATTKVVRGGSWINLDSGGARASLRSWNAPANPYFNIGFRCAGEFR